MRFALLFVLILFCFGASAQQFTISGKVSGQDGKPVPFATIYVKGTTKGTSANLEGEYSLKLKPGQYEVLYKSIGYKQESKKVDLQNDVVVNVVLNAGVYELNAVTINAKGEDPAYAIIRKAIRKRKAHLGEVKAYTCEVYIKGMQK